MSNGTTVKKRNGRGTEPLNLEKMHKMVDEATKGIAGVSASQVEIPVSYTHLTLPTNREV